MPTYNDPVEVLAECLPDRYYVTNKAGLWTVGIDNCTYTYTYQLMRRIIADMVFFLTNKKLILNLDDLQSQRLSKVTGVTEDGCVFEAYYLDYDTTDTIVAIFYENRSNIDPETTILTPFNIHHLLTDTK